MGGAHAEKFFKGITVKGNTFITAYSCDLGNGVLRFEQHPAGIDQTGGDHKIHGTFSGILPENTVKGLFGNFKKIQ